MPVLLPKNDKRQRLILGRFFIAAAGYVLWTATIALGSDLSQSLVRDPWIAYVVGGVVLTNLCFFIAIRSGFSRRWRDPSLSLTQILVAMAWLLVPLFATVQNRGLFLMADVMIIMFGVFSLRRRALMIAATFALLSYLALVIGDWLFFRERFVLIDELLRLSVLAGMMAWCIFLGSTLGDLRRKLARSNNELKKAFDEMSTIVSHDDLTQAFNRRYIMDALKQEKARTDRAGSTFSVVLMDLDHFKNINDRYGHLAGDRVLLSFAERARSTLRTMDLMDSLERARSFGRYGGEEFILLLPDTDLTGALRCAERIRRMTGAEAFDEVFEVTVSAGVAQYHDGESVESMLRRADAALYEAKARGRDKVVAEDLKAEKVYEVAVNEGQPTNVIVGPFGQNRPKN